ncbi:MAG: flagellar basal body rod protein FlgB [Candidatus Carbobacillus sp.]|nr:flagellar basal body rod protein FlgB [Candidatus Carbobacillus sp.]
MINVFYALQLAMDGAWMQQKAHAQNIANVDTPGYKRFQAVLNDVNKDVFVGNISDPRHIRIGSQGSYEPQWQLQTVKDTTETVNGNNVDLEQEMSELADTQLAYQAYITLMNQTLNRYRTVVRNGR